MLTLQEHMLATGSCIAGLGVVATGMLALLFRHPDAPRWTRPELVTMLLCIPVTVAIGFGLGYAAYGVSRLLAGSGDPRDLLVVAAVLIVLALTWRGMRIRQRLKHYQAATGGVVASGYPARQPTLATDGKPPPRPRPRARSIGRAA